MTLGAGKAMLMLGPACATELCLIVGCVCGFVSNWGWLSCGLWRCVFRFFFFLIFIFYLVLVCMVDVVGVWFPLGRVCLGTYYMCCIFGDHVYLSSLVVGLAWGIQRCACSSCCFGGYGGLVVFLVRFVEFSFFLRFFVLVLVRVVLYPRRCMIYYEVPGPHY